jgi:hypothetical protein
MDMELARARAEKLFKKEEQEREGKAAMADYQKHTAAVRENMARLKALRLAKQAQENEPTSDRKRRP